MSPISALRKPTLFNKPQTFWSQHREASLNWLALGVLLAAWNASDRDSSSADRPRPEALRGYAYVSVRAAQLVRRCAPPCNGVEATPSDGARAASRKARSTESASYRN